MGDINAAVQGCLDGGATYVCVMDGHGRPLNVIPEEMHPGADFDLRPRLRPGGRAGRDVRLRHAGRLPRHGPHPGRGAVPHAELALRLPLLVQRSRVRRDRAGGDDPRATSAFRIVLVTGDDAACREARDFLGEDRGHGGGQEGVQPRELPDGRAPGAHDLIAPRGRRRPWPRQAAARRSRWSCRSAAASRAWPTALPDTASPALVAAAPRRWREKVFEDQVGITDFS